MTTPANWRPGEQVIVLPSVSNDDASKLFGDFQIAKPYLRFTADPIHAAAKVSCRNCLTEH